MIVWFSGYTMDVLSFDYVLSQKRRWLVHVARLAVDGNRYVSTQGLSRRKLHQRTPKETGLTFFVA